MRKMSLFLALVLLLTSVFAIPASAAEPRMTTAIPGLSVNGTTATCSLRAAGNSTSDYLEATIRLYRGSTKIATWYADGYGYLGFSESTTVATGYTYTMKVEMTVNGESFPVANVSDSN